jgi:hypothetical protein
MFAGLPGIGVGTLFYVLTALWMPIPEFIRLMKGGSSAARWRLIAVQFVFALSIVASIAVAERVLLWTLGGASPASPSPARLVNQGFSSLSSESLLAAPIMASLLLLGGALLSVEVMRLFHRIRGEHRAVLATDSVASVTRKACRLDARGVDIPPSRALVVRQHAAIADVIVVEDVLHAQMQQ